MPRSSRRSGSAEFCCAGSRDSLAASNTFHANASASSKVPLGISSSTLSPPLDTIENHSLGGDRRVIANSMSVAAATIPGKINLTHPPASSSCHVPMVPAIPSAIHIQLLLPFAILSTLAEDTSDNGMEARTVRAVPVPLKMTLMLVSVNSPFSEFRVATSCSPVPDDGSVSAVTSSSALNSDSAVACGEVAASSSSSWPGSASGAAVVAAFAPAPHGQYGSVVTSVKSGSVATASFVVTDAGTSEQVQNGLGSVTGCSRHVDRQPELSGCAWSD